MPKDPADRATAPPAVEIHIAPDGSVVFTSLTDSVVPIVEALGGDPGRPKFRALGSAKR